MATKSEKHQNFTKTFQYGMAFCLIAGLVIIVCGIRVISKDFDMPEPKNRPVLTPAPKVEMLRMIENGTRSSEEAAPGSSPFAYAPDGSLIPTQPAPGEPAAGVSSGNASTNADPNSVSFGITPGAAPTEGKATFGR